jgi:thymidylate synthase (FAD)
MNTAKIIAYTQPTIFSDTEDPIYDESGSQIGTAGPRKLEVDEFVAYVARVSNPSNQNNYLTATKLLRYLAKHKHWSPFEMVNIVMEINTTRDIAHQIVRHRSFSFQEFSQRYADPTKDLGFVWRDARLQDLKNRQNSIETNDEELQKQWMIKQGLLINEVDNAYKWAIDNGIAKEQARAVLPEGLTSTRLYMNGSLRSWIHYCQIRSGIETQKEHRLIALDAWYQITEVFPSLKDALDLGA